MRVRAVEAEEWARFRDIRLRALREDPAAFGARLADEEPMDEAAWRERFARARTERFVAEDGTRWLGMAGGALGEEGAEVFGMWVAPEARGKRVGTALLDAVGAWARAHGAESLSLWVHIAQAPAVALYLRAGYAPVGEPHRGTRDPSRIFQLMRKDLTR